MNEFFQIITKEQRDKLLQIIQFNKTGEIYVCQIKSKEDVKLIRGYYKAQICDLLEQPKVKNRWIDFVDRTDVKDRIEFLALQTIYELMYYNVSNCKEYVSKKASEYFDEKPMDNWFEDEITAIGEAKHFDSETTDWFLAELQKRPFTDKIEEGIKLINDAKYNSLTQEENDNGKEQ